MSERKAAAKPIKSKPMRRIKSSPGHEDKYLALVERVIGLCERVMEESRKERAELLKAIAGVGAPTPDNDRIPSDEELWAKEIKQKGMDPDEIAAKIDADTSWDDRIMANGNAKAEA